MVSFEQEIEMKILSFGKALFEINHALIYTVCAYKYCLESFIYLDSVVYPNILYILNVIL